MANRALVMKAMDAMLTAGVDVGNVRRWCRDNGFNPRTFYRHRARIRAEGVWRERSRRQRHSPAVAPPESDAGFCKLRVEWGVENGADYIREELVRIAAQSDVSWRVPSRSTINRVLARHDLLERNPAKRP